MTIRIGGASGYWGDSALATPQLLATGAVDYLAYDYLAEITMSILVRARAKDPEAGFAADFVRDAMTPHLKQIADQGVKVVSNAGGVNPHACARALRTAIAAQGLSLKVAVVDGDDLMPRLESLAASSPREMFSGAPFPDPAHIASMNAYLGAFPIAEALGRGADIVVTGRVVDSALALGPCIHAFGWRADQHDLLAAGSLAGHLIECGPQATGGNFTDWTDVGDYDALGYPIAAIDADGAIVIRKPDGTSGAVTAGTVGEQMLYEIDDPGAYALPDVICDWTQVQLVEQEGQVRVTGAKGRPPPDQLKVSATYADGWRAGLVVFFYGDDADRKARAFADAALRRARAALERFGVPDYSDVCVELVGAETEYGDFRSVDGSRSVALKIAARHDHQLAVGGLLRVVSSLGLSAPPGLAIFTGGGRPKPSPVVRLFSLRVPRQQVEAHVHLDDETWAVPFASGSPAGPDPRPETPASAATPGEDDVDVPLRRLAWVRSGDKGNRANVGVMPRRPELGAHIFRSLTDDVVRRRFAHFADTPGPDAPRVHRYFMPGSGAMNIVLDDVLGGGGVGSLRNDAQGKGFAQLLLDAPVTIPRSLVEDLT